MAKHSRYRWQNTRTSQNKPAKVKSRSRAPTMGKGRRATEKQLALIRALCREVGGCEPSLPMTVGEASNMIEGLIARKHGALKQVFR